MEKTVKNETENLVDNLSLQDKQDVQDGLNKMLGVKIPIGDIKIAPGYIENGILDLLNKERESKKARYEYIWVRAFLVPTKKFARKGTNLKLRLRTSWFDENGFIKQDMEDRKLSSYEGVNPVAAKFVSMAFCKMMIDFQAGNPDKVATINDASIFFQFDVSNGDPVVVCNFVSGINPRKNIVDVIDLGGILKP